MVVPVNNFGVYYISDPPGYFRPISKVTHHSHNQNRLDVFGTLRTASAKKVWVLGGVYNRYLFPLWVGLGTHKGCLTIILAGKNCCYSSLLVVIRQFVPI